MLSLIIQYFCYIFDGFLIFLPLPSPPPSGALREGKLMDVYLECMFCC